MWYDSVNKEESYTSLYRKSSRHIEEYKRKSAGLGYDEDHFNWLKAVGAKPKEIYNAAQRGYDVIDYGRARKSGMSHQEYIESNLSNQHLASEKVMPSSENNPWESIPKNPDNFDTSWFNVDNSPCQCPDDKCKLTVDDPRHGTYNAYVHHFCKCRPCRDASTMYQRKRKGLDLNAPIIPNVDQQNVLDMIPIENIFNDPDDPRHRTKNGYFAGCRCDDCKQTISEYGKEFRLDKLQEMQNDPNHNLHGTTNGYNVGCRCDNCAKAQSEYIKQNKLKTLQKMQNDPNHKLHGTMSGYNVGCRCDDCKQTGSEYSKQFRLRKKQKNSSKWYEASADNDFGISKREQSEMVGHAMAEHIWEGMENIFGPIGLQSKLHTVTELEQRFPNHQIFMEEDDDPYVSHKVGDWEGRYYNGPYIDMHHKKYGVQDCIHVGHDGDERKGNLHKLTEDEFHNNVEDWINEYGPDYLAQHEPRPKRSSKWYEASLGGTCLNCGVPLLDRMDNYCGTCHNIMAQNESDAYMQVNRNHPEARPGQRARDFSGNE